MKRVMCLVAMLVMARFVPPATISGTSWTDTRPVHNTLNAHEYSANNAAGTSAPSPSNSTSMPPPASPTQPAGPPQVVKAPLPPRGATVYQLILVESTWDRCDPEFPYSRASEVQTLQSTKSFYEAESFGQVSFGPMQIYGPYVGHGASCSNSHPSDIFTPLIADGFPPGDVTSVPSTHRLGWVWPLIGNASDSYLGSPVMQFPIAVGVLPHEIGHSFNLRHSHTLECFNGSTIVTFSSNCPNQQEYGNPFDIMGQGNGFNLLEKMIMGWIAPARVASVPLASGTTAHVVIGPSNGPTTRLPRGLLLTRGTSTAFYVEHRWSESSGDLATSPFYQGVQLYAPAPDGGTNLLDASPDNVFTDPTLKLGQSVTIPSVNGMPVFTIKLSAYRQAVSAALDITVQ